MQRVLRGADERFDSQVLLDGLEEQFDLPALAIDLSDSDGGQVETIRQENELFTLGIDELDPPQPNRRLVDLLVLGSDRNDLVSENPFALRRPALDHFVEARFLHA